MNDTRTTYHCRQDWHGPDQATTVEAHSPDEAAERYIRDYDRRHAEFTVAGTVLVRQDGQDAETAYTVVGEMDLIYTAHKAAAHEVER